MGSFSIWHWLIVLLVVVLVFGTKKLRNIGSDLGSAVKGFRKGLEEEPEEGEKERGKITAQEKTTAKQADKKENATAPGPTDTDV